MPKQKKEIMASLAAKRKAEGMKRFQDWVVDNEDARQELKLFVLKLNERYNCFKFNNGDKK